MKITINQLVAAEPVLNSLANAECDNVTIAYSLAKIMKAVNDEMTLVNDARNQLAQRFGKKDSDGKLLIDKKTNTIPIEPEHQAEYLAAAEELLKQECEINIQPLPLEKINNEINFKLTANLLLAIEPFIKE